MLKKAVESYEDMINNKSLRSMPNNAENFITPTNSKSPQRKIRTITLSTVEVSNKKDQSRKLKLNNVSVQYIMNTGAAISVISASVVNTIDAEIKPYDRTKIKAAETVRNGSERSGTVRNGQGGQKLPGTVRNGQERSDTIFRLSSKSMKDEWQLPSICNPAFEPAGYFVKVLIVYIYSEYSIIIIV